MPVQAHIVGPWGIPSITRFHETLISVHFFPSIPFEFSSSPFLHCSAKRSFNVLKSKGIPINCSRWENRLRVDFSASEEPFSGTGSENSASTRKRKVVEHVSLLKAKGDLSNEEETDMLDYIYTSQYQMRGIVAISLGRISDQNPDGYTHAVYMRFQRREDLAKFYSHSFYLGVLKDHVVPYCHGLISVDYESEVEDDILPIFRKGEEFNYGVEFVLLLSVIESANGGSIEDALATFAKLTMDFPSLIVQSTQGTNFNSSDNEYTHCIVIRFRSIEAFQIFVGGSEYKDIWRSKFQPITQKSLSVHFTVDPVGTEIM
ncbi:PREDICTED: uncharacterized protein LOC104608749 [Nelumbo nucifera]|uniref:Uncharacterized protein LOC104608749 n=2 Tax=Nelumbo nucifera TaxID=4432 RepID=A0A1U8B1Q8_NELNU|nr:PREDICTED: uncharacterized protein LOC104608749 [Nelumbo nucifera]DAD47459.1 TPA_asm: hypothetical protein HUJ06_017396 [Nelumbo nucifera]